MHSRLHTQLAALALLPLVAGCVQATRHSNTMIFGTNTTFGIKVGTSANQVPAIQVGYDRQELVLMPLLANVAEHNGDENGGNLLTPCDPRLDAPVARRESNATTTRPSPQTPKTPRPDQNRYSAYAIHPCSFVGYRQNARGQDIALDSYSVLASFGAEFSVQSGSTQEAAGGLAQYFATGVAAVTLAENGGAAVVAVSDAAARSAERDGITRNLAYQSFQTRLIAKVGSTPAAAELSDRLASFESAIGSNYRISNRCTSAVQCAELIREEDSFRSQYRNDPQGVDLALEAWSASDSSD